MVIRPKSFVRSRLTMAALAVAALATALSAGGCATKSNALCSACDHGGPATRAANTPKGIPQVRSIN